MSLVKHAALMLFVLLAAACSSAQRAPVQKPPPEVPIPERAIEGAQRLWIVPEESLLYVRVRRGGRLEKLGHNHVIVFPNVTGVVYLHPRLEQSAFDLVVVVDDVTVDPEDLRYQQGEAFRTEVSDHARESTRKNMLGSRVLDASRHPHVFIRSTGIRTQGEQIVVELDLSLAGETRPLEVPVAYRQQAGRIEARGQFSLLQSDFGIEPYSVLGGALQVQDEIELVFELTAQTIPKEG